MSAIASALLNKIKTRRARTGVVGLGYVGLPLAVELAKAGFHATGIDLDARKIAAIDGGPFLHSRRLDRRRQGPARQRQAGRDHRLCRRRRARHHQHLRAHAAAEDEGPRHVLHRLGGGIDRRLPAPRSPRLPRVDDLPWNDRGSRAADPRSDRAQGGPRLLPRLLARARRPRQPDLPDAQRAEGRRRPDADVRRSSPARSTASAIETIIPVSSTRVAEMVKLLENTFRAVNIGLVNELALMCDRMAIDVWEVVDAAKTKPFGFMAFYPGPGLGRALHPDRSVLPLVEGQAERLRSAVHRAGGAHQRRDAALRRRQGRRSAQHQAQGDQRLEGAHRRRRVQARHRRHARIAGARRHGPAPRAWGAGVLRRSARAGGARSRVVGAIRHQGGQRWPRIVQPVPTAS